MESGTIPGFYRQANSQAESALTEAVESINQLAPDLVVHLGDALSKTQIKTSFDEDRENMLTTLGLLKKIKAPAIHLLGNHELKAFNQEQVDEIYQTASIEPKFFGVQEFDEFRLIWLDIEKDKENYISVPQKRVEWLRSLPESSKTTLVFCHYSLVPIDLTGSYYANLITDRRLLYLYNDNDVLKALKHLSPKLYINAHNHLLIYQIKDQIHHITNPAFSENIAADSYPENNPAVYSLLDVDKNHFDLTIFSNRFCFGRIYGEWE